MPAPKPDKSLLTAIERERLSDKDLDPVIRKRNDMIVRNKVLAWLNNSEDVRFALNHIHVRKLKKELRDVHIYTLLYIVRELLDLRDFGKLYDIGKETFVVKPFKGHHNPNFPPDPKPYPAGDKDIKRLINLEVALEEINVLLPEYNENPAYDRHKEKMRDIQSMVAEAKDKGFDLQEASLWIQRGKYYVEASFPFSELVQNPIKRSYAEKAIDAFDKAIKIDPKCVEAWINKAFMFDKLGREREALKCYNKIVKLNPKDSHSWLSRGLILYSLAGNEDAPDNALEESLLSFEVALEIDPANKLASALKIEVMNMIKDIQNTTKE